MTATGCLVCGGLLSEAVLALGKQTVTKNLNDRDHPDLFWADLDVTVCRACATVQLVRPWPHEALVPWHDWMAFREPEDHLDDVVQRVVDGDYLEVTAKILGVSSKDDTTAARFEALGFNDTHVLDPAVDLGIQTPNAYIESVQHGLTVEVAKAYVSKHGEADCLIVRHILEHTENPKEFLKALAMLMKPDGVAVFEVPDCEAALAANDYVLIWEEHNFYFTQVTLETCLAANGFETIWSNVYPYAFENSLVQVVKKSPQSRSVSQRSIPLDIEIFLDYVRHYESTCKAVQDTISSLHRDGATIVLFGAGHLGCSFLNYFRIGEFLSFAVDDAPEKIGLGLPGSGLRIRPSSDLEGIDNLVCLLAVTPDKENKIVERLQVRLEAGVKYRSIIGSSQRYIGRT